MGAGLVTVKNGFILFIKDYQFSLQINTFERKREKERKNREKTKFFFIFFGVPISFHHHHERGTLGFVHERDSIYYNK
jgi:hypothetical protein